MIRTLIGPGVFVLVASLGVGAAGPIAAPLLAQASSASTTPPHLAAPIGPGDAAIDFSLLDASGSAHALADDRGKLVLLWFLGYD